MNKNILLIVLAGIFLLMFDAYVSSELEQASYVDIPPIESARESREEQQNETQLNQSSLYSDDRAFADELADDETDGSANDENNEETEAQEPFAFSSNPSSDYYAMNSDYVGWIEVAGTRIDYPVVRGQDNEFYLEHDFYKEEHILGSIFMDYRNVGMGMDDHTILYGHYTKTGLMFADLGKYLSEAFTQDNSTIVFNDPFTDRTYEIFSVHVAPADSEYIRTSFQDDELEAYYEKLKASSNFPIESEFQEDQKMLTLISCNYTVDDGRVYVHAYEVTE